MKDLEITIAVRNNLLKERRDSLGFTRKKMAHEIGISANDYGDLESMRIGPVSPSGVWRKCALAVSNYFGVSAEELWPDRIQKIQKHSTTSKLDVCQLESLALGGDELPSGLPPPDELVYDKEKKRDVEKCCSVLTARQKDVIYKRFGLDGPPKTLRELGLEYGVTNNRVRDIEMAAIQRIRRSGMMHLSPYRDDEEV